LPSVTKKIRSICTVLQLFSLSATKIFIAKSGLFHFWNFSVCSFLTVYHLAFRGGCGGCVIHVAFKIQITCLQIVQTRVLNCFNYYILCREKTFLITQYEFWMGRQSIFHLLPLFRQVWKTQFASEVKYWEIFRRNISIMTPPIFRRSTDLYKQTFSWMKEYLSFLTKMVLFHASFFHGSIDVKISGKILLFSSCLYLQKTFHEFEYWTILIDIC
jgi:hypothetical protein